VQATNSDMAAHFDANDRVIFNDNGEIRSMDSNGTNVTTIATPAAPYQFSMFWLSPDRQQIVAKEYREPGGYETTHHERLVLMNSDGTGRTLIKPEYLGEWNLLQWRHDAGQILYYHHTFNGLPVGAGFLSTPQYVLIDLPGGSETNLCPSALCQEDNILFYTLSGDLLSLSHRALFDTSGVMTLDLQSVMPLMTDVMFGNDSNGSLYYADLLGGTNFRRFEITMTDSDGDGYDSPLDCDDTDNTVFPGATELCDGQMNDCNGSSIPVNEVDNDGDNYVECTIDAGGWDGEPSIVGGNDCDDTDPNNYHANPERCDGTDNNCDTVIDEGFNIGAVCDGVGECGAGVIECFNLSTSICSTDPGGSADESIPEVCDGLDNDCDGNIDGDANVTAIAGEGNRNIVLKDDGTVWTWGGSRHDNLIPVQVTGITNVTAIGLGWWHTIALKDDGTVWAWGSNQYGQLGDGTTTNRSNPVQVSD
jgi:hypothetical protein